MHNRGIWYLEGDSPVNARLLWLKAVPAELQKVLVIWDKQ